MPWPFGRRKNEMDVDSLLAAANISSPTSAPPVAPAAPGAPIAPGAPAAAAVAGSFRMPVEDVFSIRGRGTVVTGRIESGTVTVGMQVGLHRGDQSIRTVKVTGIEEFRKTLDSATVGANVGLLLFGVGPDDVRSGDVIAG